MLTAEQAQETLKGFQIENEPQRRLTAVAVLHEPLATAGERLGTKDKGTGDWWQHRNEWITEVAEILDKSTEADRILFFETLFPTLGEYIEKAWQIQITRLPIQLHYNRRAFRAPHTPELSRLKRGHTSWSMVNSAITRCIWAALWSIVNPVDLCASFLFTASIAGASSYRLPTTIPGQRKSCQKPSCWQAIPR